MEGVANALCGQKIKLKLRLACSKSIFRRELEIANFEICP